MSASESGRLAFWQGLDSENNPFRPGSNDYENWARGYNDELDKNNDKEFDEYYSVTPEWDWVF